MLSDKRVAIVSTFALSGNQLYADHSLECPRMHWSDRSASVRDRGGSTMVALRLAQFPSQSQLENSGSSGRAEPARSVHWRANSAGVIHCSAE